MKTTPVIPHEVNQLCELWKGCAINSVMGNYKNYKDFRRAFAGYAMQNKDYFRMINFPKVVIKSPPLIFYINALKIRILDLFTPKTKDEKAFDIFMKELKKERKAANRAAIRQARVIQKSLKKMAKIMRACAKRLS